MTAKDEVLATLARLPDSCSLAEIVDQLALRLAIAEGLADVAAGRVYAHDAVMNHFLKGAPLDDDEMTERTPS